MVYGMEKNVLLVHVSICIVHFIFNKGRQGEGGDNVTIIDFDCFCHSLSNMYVFRCIYPKTWSVLLWK